MALIDLTFFDEFVDPEELNKFFKFDSKILEYKPCFSTAMKLKHRKKDNKFIAFKNNLIYNTSKITQIFGTNYIIDINEYDLELLRLKYFSTNLYQLDIINTTTIKIDKIEKFIELDFKIVEHKKSYCFVASKCEHNKVMYENRRFTVDLNKRFFYVYTILPCIT